MNYGIPYMGSKSGIIESIALNFPKADNFYDLFGGGFSVTHYMLLQNRYKSYHYNEIKSGIVTLVQDAITGKYNYNVFKPAWISREDFHRLKDTDPYIAVCWSFGNDQRSYMFSSEIELYKKSMHNVVVFDDFDELSSEVLGFNKWVPTCKTIKQKRLFLMQKLEWYASNKKIPKILYQFLALKNIGIKDNVKQLQRLERLQQLQQLERLQQLQQLERLQQLQQLVFYSKDYREIEILSNSIVYCDIPYKNTNDYGNGFNHTDFFNWAASRKFPVFISEYHIADKRFKLIYEIDKRSKLSSNKEKTLIKQERLYWNGIT
jgi:hypothetical protein